MKISCNIIKDLLPLYYDDICSNESRKLIEEHIKTCDDCKLELKKYDMKLEGVDSMNNEININEANMIKNISKKWKRDKKTSFLLGTTIVSIIASISSIIAYNAHGSYVAEDGRLVEMFAFIPLAFLFGLISVISITSLGILSLIRYFGKQK